MEAVENMWQVIGRDAGAGVGDSEYGNVGRVRNPADVQHYFSSGRRELDGIGQQVVHDLQQPLRVVVHHDFIFLAFHPEHDVLRVGEGVQALADVAEVGQHVALYIVDF